MSPAASPTPAPDRVLRGASLVDGTGAPARPADVLVRDGRIAAVGVLRPSDVADAEVVDLSGLVLAPGFVDPHTHYDAQVLWDPAITPSSWHGVTTVVMGNCGFGVAPTRPQDRTTVMRVLENVEGMPFDALEQGIDWSFETFPEYLDRLDALPLRINVSALVGHTPIRYYVLGDEATEREATADEVARMRAIVAEAIAAGAVGWSTSRSASHVGAYGRPVPSRAAALDEIWELAGALRDAGAGTIEATWGPDLFVEELARLSADTGRPVSWAAIMTQRKDPGYAPSVAARSHELGGDVHPQIACRPIVVQVTLADPFPFANVPAFEEVLGVPRERRAERYADAAWRDRARVQVPAVWGPILEATVVAETAVHHDLVDGPTLGELAAQRGTDPLDVLADLALAEGLETRFRIPMTNDDTDQIAALLGDKRFLLALSDAGAHTSQLCDANFATYLLGHWWRERGVLSLEDAVWRITGHPAAVYGLADRGVVAPGAVADLVAFDPERIGTTTAERVRDLPGGADRLVNRGVGIEAVWVAGTAIRSAGVDADGVAPGALLRGGRG
jgi:N-acyl-D-amino-acid deacylase